MGHLITVKEPITLNIVIFLIKNYPSFTYFWIVKRIIIWFLLYVFNKIDKPIKNDLLEDQKFLKHTEVLNRCKTFSVEWIFLYFSFTLEMIYYIWVTFETYTLITNETFYNEIPFQRWFTDDIESKIVKTLYDQTCPITIVYFLLKTIPFLMLKRIRSI